MRLHWQLRLLASLHCVLIVASQTCDEVPNLDSPKDRPSFHHMDTVEATAYQDSTVGTKIAEVYAFGYAHCQFNVRYQAESVSPSDATDYFAVTPNDGSNTDGIIRRVGGDLTATSNRGRVFEIRIKAFYTNNPDSSAFVSVNVKITILQNNRAPVFNPSTQPRTFSEYDDIQQGDILYRYTFTDSEDGVEGQFEYFVRQTSPDENTEGGQYFSIDPKTGDLYVNRDWSFSVGESFVLQLYALDFGDPRLKSIEYTITITIILRPKTPIFLHDKYSIDTPERVSYDAVPNIPCASGGDLDFYTAGERRLIGVRAVDGNTERESDITYSIQSVTPSGHLTFHIVDQVIGNSSNRGDVYMCGYPNREYIPEYILVIRATDRDLNSNNEYLYSETHLYVNITDRNEDPRFLRSHYYGTIAEWAHSGAVVVDYLEAEDDDIGVNAILDYSIVSNSVHAVDVFNNAHLISNSSFTIDQATGVLRDNIDSINETYRYFRLNVQVTDRGSPTRTATTQVYLTIIDINDNEPVFQSPSYTSYRCENRGGMDDFLFRFTVSDYDIITSHTTLTFATEGHFSDDFYIPGGMVQTTYPQPDSQSAAVTTGELRVTGQFDYETNQKIDVVLLAQDNSDRPLTGTANVDLIICDENDKVPYFEHPIFNVTMPESTAVGTNLTSIRVLDDDSPANSISTLDSLDSRFSTDNSHNAMGIFNYMLAMTINIEDLLTDCFDVTVRATNAPGSVSCGAYNCQSLTQTATTTVHMCITDVNEFCPMFDSPTYDERIDENSPSGTDTGIDVHATDGDKHDPNNVVRYFIVPASNDHVLAVNKETGQITIDNPPDYEAFPSGTAHDERCHSMTVGTFDLGAKDNPGYGPCNDQTVVKVCINNLNDEELICDACPYEGEVHENAPAGTHVVTVKAIDPDGFAVTYSITTDDSSNAFQVDGSSGAISVLDSSTLDYEQQTVHNLVITASDGSQSITIHVTISVLDDNDQCPQFDTANIPHSTNVNECPNDNRGGYVTTVSAFDEDTDPNVNTRYSIESTVPAGGPFIISPLTGEIHVSQVGLDPDASGTTQWTLTIRASDTGHAACDGMDIDNTIDITVDVTDCNDITPVITLGAYHDVCEGDAIGTVAMDFTVADGDLSSPNNQFTVEIVSGTNGPLQDGVAPFMLADLGSGSYQIQFATANIDREDSSTVRDGDEKALFYPTVRVTDQGTLPGSLMVEREFIIRVCDINDNCPRLVPAPPDGGYNRTISEHTPQQTTVIQLSAFDPDSAANSNLQWTTSGCDSHFAIDSSTGRFYTTADLMQGSVHSCQICVDSPTTVAGITPACPQCVDLQVTVTDINNNCPIITFTTPTTSFPEQENADDSYFPQDVTTITVTDADGSDTTELTLRIANPSGISTDALPFVLTEVGPVGGTLTSTLRLRGPTDHEDVSHYNILLIANDRVVIDGDTTGGHSCETSMLLPQITITDVVDEPPVLSSHHYEAYVDEGLLGGALVYSTPGITATDLDALLTSSVPPDGVFFSINPNPVHFTISPSALDATGQPIYTATLYTAAILDREDRASYVFNVVAEDSGGLTDTATVRVTVRDINDFIPTCNQTYLNLKNHMWTLEDGLCYIRVNVCENATVDHRVLDIVFFDAFYDEDSGNNGNFYLDVQHYSPGGDTTPDPANPGLDFQDDFGIRQQDLLVITQQLNYETLAEAGSNFETYHLRVLARDQGSPQLTGTILVDVNVCDSNDNPPIFKEPEVRVEICEEVEGLVYTLTVNDLDFGTNSMQRFVIKDVEPVEFLDQFYLSGTLSHSQGDHESTTELWSRPLDRETREIYVVYVEAKDLGHPTMSATATVTVVLKDLNDNTPTWSQSYSAICEPFSLNEELPLYYVISSFAANDGDSGANAELIYSIQVTPPDEANRFTIGANDGDLRQNIQSLDYDDATTSNYFSIAVTVRDGGANFDATQSIVCAGGPQALRQNMNTATICFNLININDNPPVCPSNDYVCINEYPFDDTMTSPNIYTMDVYGKFPCTDADGNTPTNFRYSIGDSVDSSLFHIDDDNMLVIAPGAENMFDRERDDELHLTLVVTDNGYPDNETVMNHTIFVTVCLNDANDNVPTFDEVPVACVPFAEGIGDQDVINLVVRDPDLGVNGQLTATHTEKGGTTDFSVDIVPQPDSAVNHLRVRPTQPLDRERQDLYFLTITVSDMGTQCLASNPSTVGPCSRTIELCIRITDINDNSNNLTDIFFCISEDPMKTPIGSTIFTMNVVDPDLGNNAVLEYDIVNGTIDIPFSVTRTTGKIILAAPVDYETITIYHLVVTVRDTGNFSQSEYANLTICIINEPDTPPRFSVQPILNATEERVDQFIGTLADFVYDPDMLGEQIYYVLPDQSEFNDIISIDLLSGNITVVRRLNREVKDTYTLTVGATNEHSSYQRLPLNTETAYAQLVIRVLDINDNAPMFENPFYLIAIDHQLEYGEEVDSVYATDVDLQENGTVNYEFVHGFDYEPYFWINTSTGVIMTAGAFVWKIGARFEFMVRAYDRFKMPLEISQNDDGWRYQDVPITFYAAEDQTRVIVRIDISLNDVDSNDRICVKNVLETVSHYMIYIDRVRHAASDSYYEVSPSITEFVVHAVHPNTREVPHADELLNLLNVDQLADLLQTDCELELEATLIDSVRPIPIAYDRTDVYIGLIVGVVLGGFFILCCCLLCGCLCCWERRRRRTYQKKIVSVSNLDQFSHSFFATKNPLFVPALGDASSESVESGSIADRDNILYASQELEVTLEDEPGEDEDWLKMDQPPDWLLPPEVEEYDDWTPPQKKPLLLPPPAKPVVVEPQKVVTVERQEVTTEKVETVKEEDVKVEEQKKEVVPVGFRKVKKKEKKKDYEEQETFVEMFADVDSEGLESEGELRLSNVPSEIASDEEEVQVDADTFGVEAFQSTLTSGDFQFDDDTPLIK